jgi:NADPH:quinone reductase-like Zn-dependent oxidoreductase
MRAIRLGAQNGLQKLRLVQEDYLRPGRDEILVKIRACSLNMRDDFIAQGKAPSADGCVPLSDGAGEVIEVGADVKDFEIGDNVVSVFYPFWLGGEMTSSTNRRVPGEHFDGYARELACVPANAFTKAPAGYTHLEAATLTCTAVTAWKSLIVCGQLKPGDTVLTLGTGSLSLFALQLAKAAGARVIATSSSHEKLERLKALGADLTIDYNAFPDWGSKVRELTQGRGVDHVIEVGGPATFSQSIDACTTGGHIALVGVLTGFFAEFSVPAIFSNQIRISGVSIGSRADQEDMIRAISANTLKPIIDRTFPLEDIADAFNYYETHKHFGKVCLEV